MRILHVVPAYIPAFRYGGPIRSVHGLAKAQAACGHRVEVYTTTLDGPKDLDVPVGRPVDLDGVLVHYFPVPALRRLAWPPSLGTALNRHIDNFDIIHLHSVFLLPTLIAARIASRRQVPYLLSPRGMLVPELIRRKSRVPKTLWIRAFESRTIADAAAIHVTSDVEAEALKQVVTTIPRMVNIPNGVDIPSQESINRTPPLDFAPESFALSLGRISWKKGLDRLIQCWRHVPDLALIIAGNDEEDATPGLRRIADECGISDRVHFIGAVSDDDKWSLYARAKLFLLLSHSENFGNVVAEAMAAGCPTVVTPEVGIAPIVQAHNAGIIVSGDPDASATPILSLLSDPHRLSDMRRSAANLAAQTLSWKAVSCRMLDAYSACIQVTRES